MIIRLTVVLLLLGTSVGLAGENQPGDLERRGLALAEDVLAMSCDRQARRVPAGAPPFRALDRRLDLDSFMERCAKGS